MAKPQARNSLPVSILQLIGDGFFEGHPGILSLLQEPCTLQHPMLGIWGTQHSNIEHTTARLAIRDF